MTTPEAAMLLDMKVVVIVSKDIDLWLQLKLMPKLIFRRLLMLK
jgi:hypothetical protein